MKTVFRTFKYRLLPTRRQHKELTDLAESQRQLYNAALQERIDCYSKTGKGRSYIDQCKALAELRQDKEFSSVPSNMQRWTLKRVDEAYKGFFKRGGFPRYRGFHRWKSFGFAEFSGIRFDGQRLRFKGLHGGLRVHLHHSLQGEIKSCVFRRDIRGWYVCFQCAISVKDVEHDGGSIGIDIGLNHFATLSDGEKIPNPRIARKAQKELRRRQRALARCKRGSNRRRKVRDIMTRAYAKITNTRKTFLHQQTARIVSQYSAIAVEDLKIANMVKGNLARSIHDAGWGMFIQMLLYKAESAGAQVIKVDPYNTTQKCSGCGDIVRKTLKERVHNCPRCGLVADRDTNAALNILSRGVVIPYPANVGGCVERLDGNISGVMQ